MQPDRQNTLFSVLGVVQYRKRVPRKPSLEAVDVESAASLTSMASVSENIESLSKTPLANSIQDLKAIANDLGAALKKPSATELDTQNQKEKDVRTGKDQAVPDNTPAGSHRAFEMLFWRCGNLLALETTSTDAVEEQLRDTKHRLVNNIFRTIFGADASGASMYHQSWPDALVTDKNSDEAALGWLTMFLKGQQAKDPDTRLWLMGADALELLFADSSAADQLEGVKHSHATLGLDIYVTPTLDKLVSQPYLKAGAWQLLRALSP